MLSASRTHSSHLIFATAAVCMLLAFTLLASSIFQTGKHARAVEASVLRADFEVTSK